MVKRKLHINLIEEHNKSGNCMQNQRELVTKMKFSLHSEQMPRISNLFQEYMLFMHKIKKLVSKQKELLSRVYCVEHYNSYEMS